MDGSGFCCFFSFKKGVKMGDNKISTPSSQTGLVRFYDVSSSNIQVTPQLVVGFAVAVIVLELLLQAFAGTK